MIFLKAKRRREICPRERRLQINELVVVGGKKKDKRKVKQDDLHNCAHSMLILSHQMQDSFLQ